MDRNAIASNVAVKLLSAERAIDSAMVEAAQLVESMVQARLDMRVAAASADVALTRATEALSALAEARRAASATHSALANVQQEFGLQVTGAGPLEKSSASLETANPLRIAG
jgi:hypothetical protein